jgi:hypothetical protein
VKLADIGYDGVKVLQKRGHERSSTEVKV